MAESAAEFLSRYAPTAKAPGPAGEVPVPFAEAAQTAQMSGALRLPAMAGSDALRGGAKTVGMIGDFQQWLASKLPSYNAKQGPEDPSLGVAPQLPSISIPTTNELMPMLKERGLIDRPDLYPQNQGEKYLSAVSEGAGSTVPLLPLGQPIAALAAGAMGGAAGQAAKDLLPDSEVAPAVAGLVAGIGTQGLVSMLATGRVERIAAAMGQSKTWQEAGTQVQQQARTYLEKTMPARLESIWAPVDSQMQGAAAKLTNFETELAKQTSKSPSVQPVVDELSPKMPARLQDALGNSVAGLTGSATWADVKTLRTALGDALKNPMVVKDLPADSISKLYRALTKDMEASAQAVSPTALKLFKEANKESTDLYKFAEGTLGKIVAGAKASAGDPVPEMVAKRLLTAGKAGGSDLQALRAKLPEAVNELGAAHLRAGLDPSSWTKLSPEAKEALIPNERLRSTMNGLAKEALPKSPGMLAQGVSSIAGNLGGNVVGRTLAHGLGMDPNVVGDIGSAIGMISPFVWQGGRMIANNPLALVPPAAGANAGNTQR